MPKNFLTFVLVEIREWADQRPKGSGRNEKLIDEEPEKIKALLLLLDERVRNSRCTLGEPLKHDRDVKFLPADVTMPERN